SGRTRDYRRAQLETLLSPILGCRDARKLRSGLPQDRDILVGILPEGEEILIRRASCGDVARHGESSCKTQVGKSTDGTVTDDPAVFENLLEFARRGSSLLRSQECRRPDIDRKHCEAEGSSYRAVLRRSSIAFAGLLEAISIWARMVGSL